ncbi:hypothetical protein QCA50_011097 [Cerrena zonata]|uniref:pyridoxal kinase n=1 Tax=Cerrena zonata TaxID=2478898 RepID=A0AAW0FY56_9APHY
MSKGRVLSIQSHVAFGYVGGKAAVFPLQCLDYDVDVVNTVNFSNHSGYGYFGGPRATATDLNAIFEVMEANGLLKPERLLTGYIPGAEALFTVKQRVTQLRERKPTLVYLLDPVLGDAGKLYVAADVIPIYRSMLPFSTIITPNWFEVEVLTDTCMSDLPSLRKALRILHEEYKVPNIVISSIPLRDWLQECLPENIRPSTTSDDGFLLCISSSAENPNSRSSTIHACAVPTIPGYFSGVGDLFSALVLAHYEAITDSDIKHSPVSAAASQALTKTHGILSLTHEHARSLPEEERLPTDEELDVKEPMRKIKRMRGRELRLIQGQDIIRGTKEVEFREMQPWNGFWNP